MAALNRKFFVNGLAFVAVLMKGKDAESAAMASQTHDLAQLIMAYCAANDGALQTKASPEMVLDRAIDRHKTELRDEEETRLPQDRQALIGLHGRLQSRKALRTSRDFYGYADEDKLANAVLALLDEEIEAEGRTRLP